MTAMKPMVGKVGTDNHDASGGSLLRKRPGIRVLLMLFPAR